MLWRLAELIGADQCSSDDGLLVTAAWELPELPGQHTGVTPAGGGAEDVAFEGTPGEPYMEPAAMAGDDIAQRAADFAGNRAAQAGAGFHRRASPWGGRALARAFM